MPIDQLEILALSYFWPFLRISALLMVALIRKGLKCKLTVSDNFFDCVNEYFDWRICLLSTCCLVDVCVELNAAYIT